MERSQPENYCLLINPCFKSFKSYEMTILQSNTASALPASKPALDGVRISSKADTSGLRIYDIRRGKTELCLTDDITRALKPNDEGKRTLPTLLLYDEDGLKLFEAITYLDEYYLTNAEIKILKTNCNSIAERVESGCQLVELGSG